MTSSGRHSPLPIRADALVLENRCEAGNGPGINPDISPGINSSVNSSTNSSINYRLSLEIPAWPGAEPGQFLMLSPGAQTDAPRTDPLLPRPMAVYRGFDPAPAAGAAVIEVLYKATGRGTRLIAETLSGQRMRIVGPLGRGFPAIPAGGHSILVGGGTGVASLFELAARAQLAAPSSYPPQPASEQGGLSLILGARTATDLMGGDDFAALGVDLRITTEDGSLGQRGLVTDVLAEMLEATGPSTTVYACGPTPMMRACAELSRARGARCLVSLENNMACGFGVCLGCATPLKGGGFSLVCCDGPVFAAEEVCWEELP